MPLLFLYLFPLLHSSGESPHLWAIITEESALVVPAYLKSHTLSTWSLKGLTLRSLADGGYSLSPHNSCSQPSCPFPMETSLGRKGRYGKDLPSRVSQGPCRECLSGPGEEGSEISPFSLVIEGREVRLKGSEMPGSQEPATTQRS